MRRHGQVLRGVISPQSRDRPRRVLQHLLGRQLIPHQITRHGRFKHVPLDKGATSLAFEDEGTESRDADGETEREEDVEVLGGVGLQAREGREDRAGRGRVREQVREEGERAGKGEDVDQEEDRDGLRAVGDAVQER